MLLSGGRPDLAKRLQRRSSVCNAAAHPDVGLHADLGAFMAGCAQALRAAEDDDWSEVSLHDHFNDLEAVVSARVLAPTALALGLPSSAVIIPASTVGHHGHGLRKIVLAKIPFFIDHLSLRFCSFFT